MTCMEKAVALRADTTTHYNCAQAVLIPFAAQMGLTEEQTQALGSHFGSGMRHGATCGAVTGALMVLGMMGYDGATAAELLRQVRETHHALDCTSLLTNAATEGISKKEHCDGMVFDLVQKLDTLLSA